MKRRTFFSAVAGLFAVPFVRHTKASPSNDELKKIAEQNPPPPEWFEGETIGTFGSSDNFSIGEWFNYTTTTDPKTGEIRICKDSRTA